MKTKLLLIVVLLLSSFSLMAQKGTIKIFYELKGVSVYLNDELKGIDVGTLDSVTIGNHYLKVTKDNIIVFGEIVTVSANAVTTILIKKNKDLQEKIIAGKTDELHQYESQRLDVMLSTKYVTETNSKSNSVYYPGFFSTTIGQSKTNSVTTTIPVTDWFITQGGTRKISQREFARITNYQPFFEQAEKIKQDVEKHNKKIVRGGLIAAALGLATIAAGIFVVHPKVDWNSENNFNWGAGGEIMCYTTGGLALIGVASLKKELPYDPILSMETIQGQAYIYNQNLKKKLGIPEDYEPK